MKMAVEDTQDMQRSYKELKKMAKQQKKAKKKAKKQAKMEKKISKKQAKMRKKGMFLEDITTAEVVVEEEKPEEYEGGPWVRKSTESIPYLEKKIDRMAERRKRSSLHDLFEERYGESLIVPETYKEYELSDEEKRRLEELGVKEKEVIEPVEAATIGEEVQKVAVEGEAVSEEEGKTKEVELKPIYYPLQLWLYTKYGQDKKAIIKYLILVISGILFIFALIPRIIIFVIITIIKKIKEKRASKAAPEA